MSIFEQPSELVISCYKRLGIFLEQELKTLGFTPERVAESFVTLQGTATDAMHLNMKLRTASQILYKLHSFPAEHPDHVYEALVKYPFEELLPADCYFSVTSIVKHESVNNPMFLNLRVKDAIVDRMRAKNGKRPDTGPEHNKAVIHLYWVGEEAILYADTSGETLARHGYRLHPGKAPLLESLAASMVMASGWTPDMPLLNPMGGTGTLAIEAACIATNRYPGLYRRRYGFMYLKGFDQRSYLEAVLDLEDAIQEVEMEPIVINDRDKRMLSFALQNAEKAGVAHMVETISGDYSELAIPETPGWVLLNPEYGERLGEVEALSITYAEIGTWMKKSLPGWKVGIISGNQELLSKVGLKPDRRIPLYNGRIDSRLCLYSMYAGTKRVFGEPDATAVSDSKSAPDADAPAATE